MKLHHRIPPSASMKRSSSGSSCAAQQPIPTTATTTSTQHHQHQPGQLPSSGSSASTLVPLYGNRVYKRQKTVNESSSSTTAATTVFDKLNPGDPVHKQRMAAREKAIQKGKNTAGYDAYLHQIPKHQRRPRSMETPSTPDPTLDIPAKRWQGMVKAWRVALHKYDPPDLVNTSGSSSSSEVVAQSKTPMAANSVNTVAPTPASATPPVKLNNKGSNLQLVVLGSHDTNSNVPLEETTPVSLASPGGLLEHSHSSSSSPLFAASSRNALDFEDDDDSDDDIL